MKLRSGSRQQIVLPSVNLSDGRLVTNIPMVFESWGIEPAGGSPVFLLIHALTGSSHAKSTQEDPTPGWWEEFLGTSGEAIDLTRCTVIAPNLPGSCYGSWVPDERDEIGLSIADQSRILAALISSLGISSLDAVIGGSLGGMVALQFCADKLIPVKKAVILSCGARQSAWAKSWGHLGLSALKNSVNESAGLALARQIAMLSYRTPPDFDSKDQPGKTVQHYLYYQGSKFVNRFTTRSYELLVRAMDTHSVTSVLDGIDGLIIGNQQDLLYPLADQEAVCSLFPVHRFVVINSDKGHDAFLTESDDLNPVIRDFLHGTADLRLTGTT